MSEQVAKFEVEMERVEAIPRIADQVHAAFDLRTAVINFQTEDAELQKRLKAVEERMLKILMRTR